MKSGKIHWSLTGKRGGEIRPLHGESSDRSSLLQVFREFPTEIFSTSIASQLLDLRSVLGLQPCFIIDVVVKDLIFLLHEVDFRVS